MYSQVGSQEPLIVEEVNKFTRQVISSLPASTQCLQEIRQAQKAEEEFSQVTRYQEDATSTPT